MSDSLPKDTYDQGVYDAANGNAQSRTNWDSIALVVDQSKIDAYNAGYNGDPRPT